MHTEVDRSGTDIGPYTLKKLIGRGGMGVVYEALDTRLGRSVALKVLLPEVVQDLERRTRFEREAKALAALKHPGIVTIHTFETIGEDTFFTMELLEGCTLGEIMRDGGSMPVERVLQLGIPIADALATAHRNGIFHRDIKPDNIIVDIRDQVSVLDFGLAKLAAPVIESNGEETASMDATVEGRIIGTIRYMAPEQAQGAETNATTDVFSLGIVLYEMATGATPFPGDTTVSKISSIIKDEPRPMDEFTDVIPPELERLIARCLAKDPDRRWQNAIDVRNELELLRDELENPCSNPSVASSPPQSSVKIYMLALIAAVIGIVAGVGISNYMIESALPPVAPVVVSKPVEPDPQLLSVMGPDGFELRSVQISPDGSRVVMGTKSILADSSDAENTAREDRLFLHVRAMDSFDVRLVEDSQRTFAGKFSPDGSAYIFVRLPSDQNQPAKLMRLELASNLPPVQIGAIPLSLMGFQDQFGTSRGFAWLNTDTLVFLTEKPYHLVSYSAKNGDEKSRVPLAFDKDFQPGRVLDPIDESRFLLNVNTYDVHGFIQDVMWVDAGTGEYGMVVEGSPFAEIVGGNRLLFTRGETMYETVFNPTERIPVGESTPVLNGIRTQNSWSAGVFDTSDDGTLVFLPGGLQGSRRLLYSQAEGEDPVMLQMPPRPFEQKVAVSADGLRILVTHTNGDNAMWDLWGGTLDPPRVSRSISFPDKDIFDPVISQDGTMGAARINTTRPAYRNELIVFSSGSTGTSQTVQSVNIGELIPYAIHPNNDRLVYGYRLPMDESQSLMETPLVEGGESKVLISGPAIYANAAWSPDGSLLAFTTNETGFIEVMVAIYGPDGIESPVPVSNSPANVFGWSTDGEKGFRIHYFTNLIERTRTVEANDGRIVLGPPVVTGRTLGDTTTALSMDHGGSMYTIRKGDNEEPAAHMEIITGRFPVTK
jgi:serine/threonine protein kinase